MAQTSEGLSRLHAALFDPQHVPGECREVVPQQPHLLITIDNFFSEAECSGLVAAACASGLQPPSASDLNPRKNEAFLNREMSAFVDPQFAARIWTRLLPSLPTIDGREPVGLHGDKAAAPGLLKYYRYVKGMRFDQHVDASHKGPNPGEETEYTLASVQCSSPRPPASSPAFGAQAHTPSA